MRAGHRGVVERSGSEGLQGRLLPSAPSLSRAGSLRRACDSEGEPSLPSDAWVLRCFDLLLLGVKHQGTSLRSTSPLPISQAVPAPPVGPRGPEGQPVPHVLHAVLTIRAGDQGSEFLTPGASHLLPSNPAPGTLSIAMSPGAPTSGSPKGADFCSPLASAACSGSSRAGKAHMSAGGLLPGRLFF